MSQPAEKAKRGFTSAEKWIIWAVFCLLVALSSHRFTVFAGLMLVSAGVALLYRRKSPLVGLGLTALGVAALAFSPVLF